MNRALGVAELLDELREARTRLPSPHAGIAFDADGTLWTGDVGDDVFFYALEHDLLHEAAVAPLQRLAAAHGLDGDGTPGHIARRLYEAYRVGALPEPTTYAMMTWCFAGYAPSDLARLAREVLDAARLAERLCGELRPILEWARGADVRTLVISASPQPVVELAARYWGFDAADVAAAVPATDAEGRIVGALSGAVPYGPHKVSLGRERLGAAHWLAAFGDNDFDADMLTAAARGVAVRPKPALRAKLASMREVVELLP